MERNSEAMEAGAVAALGEFGLRLKGWRSQLRWALTQREEDPARVWLEIISIDERSKRAVAGSTDPVHLAELAKFRTKLEKSIAALTEDLGDNNVAPLYAWLDLVKQRRRLVGRVEEARGAVAQARVLRAPEGARLPADAEEAAAQLAQAQGELVEWRAAKPPEPPPEVQAVWVAEGGDTLRERMPRVAMAVGRRGDAARALLARASGRSPGKHPWHGSTGERVALPTAGAAVAVFGGLALTLGSTALGCLAGLALVAAAGLAAASVQTRRLERAEIAAALDWMWHCLMYEERTRFAELEAGWLRALVRAERSLKSFDDQAGSGGQLRDFERERPDLKDMVFEVARDTDDPLAALPYSHPPSENP